MKNKHYCIHAHFDLPARENPWLDESEPDPSRSPYRDERERALFECYGPNSASPLLDMEGRILDFVNSYASLSFDFAPELLSFIEQRSPRVYRRILEADRQSVREHGGHGNALATADEERTAVRWAVADFQRRFGRRSEGFWLPEDCADQEILETLIEEGISFALLSPGRAEAVRTGAEPWLEVTAETLDTRRPYRWNSRRDPGKSLNLFFYRTDLSLSEVYSRLPHAVAASADPEVRREALLDTAQRFAHRLVDSFTVNDAVELSHLATPGDIYGLSRLHGDRALAYALDLLFREAPAARVNYGEFLELFPPPQEVRLLPRTPDRGPLREALEELATELDAALRERAQAYFADWPRALAGYGSIIGGGADLTVPFFEEHAAKHLSPDEARQAIRLCEAARWRLKMTSASSTACAARAMDLLETPPETRKRFVAALSKAPASQPAYINAAEEYNRLVLPMRIDAEQALAHFAVADHLRMGLEPGVYDPEIEVLCRRPRRFDRRMASLSVYRVRIRRARTYERARGTAAVLRIGDSDIRCWVKLGDESDPSAELDEAFSRRSPEAAAAAAERLFGQRGFGIDALFPAVRREAIAGLTPRGSPERRDFLQSIRGLPLEAVFDGATGLDIPPDTLPGVRGLRRKLVSLAEDFAREPHPSLIPLLTALEAALRSGLSVPLWELQELSWQGLKRWIGNSREPERRKLASLLGLSGALFIFPPARSVHGD